MIINSLGYTKRIQGIDAARGIAIFLLLFFHAPGIYNFITGLPIPKLLFSFNELFIPYRMPTLMLVAGLFVVPALEKPLNIYLRRLFSFLVWPYILWVPILLISGGWVYFQAFYLTDFRPWIAPGYLWFLGYLIVYRVAILFFRRIPMILIAIVLYMFAIATQFLWPEINSYSRLIIYGVFFFFGAALYKYLDKIFYWGEKPPILIFLAVITFAYSSLITFGFITFSSLFAVPISISGAVLVIILANRYGTSRFFVPFIFIGRNSIVYYLSHWISMATLSRILLNEGITSWKVQIPLLLIAGISGGTILALARKFIPFRWLFVAPFAIQEKR